MPARSNIPSEAFEEISSGKLGFREARRIYGIGHIRYKKIQQRVEAKQQQQAPSPTVKDVYKRLEGLESQAEHSTRLLAEVLAQLASNNAQDAFFDELEDIAKELATTASRLTDTLEEARHEQTETRMDLQKVGQMVETAQKWTYISLAAILVWKVVGATWKRCTPVAVGRDIVQQQEKQGHTAAPPPPPVVAEQRAKPGDPFYMAG